MSEPVEFSLADGTQVFVDTPSSHLGTGAVGLGDGPRRSQRSLRQALAPVTSAASEVIAEFRAHALHPEEIEVSFGVTLDVEIGAVISSAKTSCHLDVTLRWSGNPGAGAAPATE